MENIMERWVLLRKGADYQAIGKKFHIAPRIACLIRNREVIGDEAIDQYLNGTIADLHDGMLMKGMDQAVDILMEKIREGARIRVIGDYDIDGVNATYILLEALEGLRGEVDMDIPDRITADAIKSCLETKWMAKNLEYYDEIDSTNNRAKALGEAGGADGTLFVAETQTAGKGRRGRCWQSPAGSSISMSILLRPVMNPSDAPMLTLVMAYAATKALREKTELDIGIKWPNDLVVSGKKISGILTEMSAEIDYINHVVIGIGINVNMESFPEDIAKTATSLRIEAGKEFRRFELIAAIMEHFEKAYEAVCEAGNLEPIMEDYNRLLVNCGRRVRVLEPEHEYDALALGIDKTGELQVECEDGSRKSVFAGEVSVRGIYGYV